MSSTEIEPGTYHYDLEIGVPEGGATVTRSYGGEIVANPPAIEDEIRTWLVNLHCADLKGQTVTVTHFKLTRI